MALDASRMRIQIPADVCLDLIKEVWRGYNYNYIDGIFGIMWSSDEIDLLILLVQDCPDIYDYSLAGHSNVQHLEKCWLEIARNFPDKDVKQLKTKWQILRGGYRQRRRHVSAKKSSDGSKPNIIWPYFDQLKFLDPFLNSRSSTKNTSSVEEFIVNEDGIFSSTEIVDTEVQSESTDDPITSGSSTPCTTAATGKVRKQSDDLDDVMTNYFKKKMARTDEDIEKASNDPIRAFLNSLIPDMEQLTGQNLRIFKIDMLTRLNELINLQAGSDDDTFKDIS
ncbi:unnamed protein product [Callosobruchus maculatus]|uniref:Uncharacterized protein n=1 Tax=Callosobruchus maculatus TaxID=64391 RepID=A0A653BYL1_CALMS|nr:unnamed protein product [Callosobruchus maculatus]